MSFRIIVGTDDGGAAPRDDRFDLAAEAFAAYRRLIRKKVAVKGILDLRAGDQRQITSAELEAIAWCERRDGYKTAERRDDTGRRL